MTFLPVSAHCLDVHVQCVCHMVICTTPHPQLAWSFHGHYLHVLQDHRASAQHDLIALQLSWLKHQGNEQHDLPFPQQERHHASVSHPSCISA